MKTFSPVIQIVGIISMLFAVALLPSAFLDYFYGHINWQAFLISFIILFCTGAAMTISQYQEQELLGLSIRQVFIITTAIWIMLCLAASLPFIFSHATTSTVDSIFEATSALTGTGASIMFDLNNKSLGILLWRAMLQWMGGIGIIVMAMVILPMLKIGGMQLFTSEFSDKSNEKILPQVSQITSAILNIYLFCTLACGIGLYIAGMGVFDAICHALTVISTGGLSTKDGSIADFNNNHIKLVCIPFMLIGATTLLLFVKLRKGDWRCLFQDMQLRIFISLIIIVTIILMMARIFSIAEINFWQNLLDISFNVVSVFTTSGFAATDYTQYTPFAVMLLFIISLIGGCTGSSAGGIKVFRLQVMYIQMKTSLLRLSRNNKVVFPMNNNKVIEPEIFDSVYTYITLFGLCLIIAMLLTSFMGVEFKKSIYACCALLTNVGPAMEQTIGPFGSYTGFSHQVKTLFIGLMILGRLEFIAIVVMLQPSFWRSNT